MFQRGKFSDKLRSNCGKHCVRRLYEKLAQAEQLLEIHLEHWPSVAQRAAGAVVHEDLLVLLEECENYLFDWCQASGEDLRSFEVRSVTVLEEVQGLLHRQRGAYPDLDRASHQ